LILWRRSDSWIGLLTALLFVTTGTQAYSGNYFLMLEHYPGLRYPMAILNSSIALLIPFMALFPNGRFVPRWTPLYVIVATPVVLLGNSLYGFAPPLSYLAEISLPLTSVSILIGFIAQVIRYRKFSTPVEKQQTKWVLAGFAFFVSTLLLLVALISTVPLMSPTGQVAGFLAFTFFFPIALMSIPIAVGISLLRYRLWDIDVLIRRTLIYTVLTVSLALVFFGGVALFQRAFGALTGTESSPVAIVLSTLGIAALFSPLQRRVRDFIDRRFYRKKYDAQKTLEAFAAVSRNEVELEELTTNLLKVTNETMQPEKLSLWLIHKPENTK
jgi:hypothetical protein